MTCKRNVENAVLHVSFSSLDEMTGELLSFTAPVPPAITVVCVYRCHWLLANRWRRNANSSSRDTKLLSKDLFRTEDTRNVS